MDSDDGLMLNIAVSKNDDSVASISGKRSKIKWKERREQRKRNYTPYRETQNTDKRENKLKNSDWITDSCNVKIKDTEDNKNKQVPKTTSKTQVISSLFRHNPEIPKVQSPVESQGIKDEGKTDKPLFSGDKFSELPLSPHMVSNLENNLQMTTLTSIQRSAIPSLIEGKDVFVKSKTGSGKTLCYAVPIVHSLQKIRPKIERSDGPYALVLVPTRELALQSLSLLQKLVKPFQWIVPGFVVGGEKRKSEKARLRKGINILVATPGRLLDHIEKTSCLELKNIKWIILDEADRLLDMGFEKDVSTILQSIKDKLPSTARCQTVLMSATLSKGVEKLVHMFLTDPEFVDESGKKDVINKDNVKTKNDQEDITQNTPQQLKQFFVIVPSKMRLVTLAAFIISKHNTIHPCKSIVFLSSRDSVDFHHTLFKSLLCKDEGKTFKLFKLHGNMSQTERTEVFKEYSACSGGVLLCTDVAARGLDLPNVNWIVQYNTPGSAVEYIHRVGRTARIGTEGQALLFLMPSEAEYLNTLEEHLIRPKEVIVSDVLRTLLPSEKRKAHKRGKNKDLVDNLVQEAATTLQMKFEEFVLSNAENMKSAKKAYQSFVRSYATFPAGLKHIFHVKNLHLGHVAKAFALRDAPTGMFAQGKEKRKIEKKRKKSFDKPTLAKKRGLPVDEYLAEGAFSGPRPKKKKNKGR